jgi:hypothetical protein
VYLTASDADVVTGDQIKTEGGLQILKLGHMEPWAIAMMCATLLIGMGTCGACCHKGGKSYVRDKEKKLRDRALGRAKELVHMKAHGADKLLEDVQTYHDMHNKIVVQKMHQIMPPRTGGRYAERPCGNPQCGDCKKTETHCRRVQQQRAEGNNHQRTVANPSISSKLAKLGNGRGSGQQPAKEHRGQNAVATKKHRDQDAVAADDCRDAERPLRQQRYQRTFHLSLLGKVGSDCKR